MYVTWSRILLFICTQETDDKKKGLKRLTAMFYVTSFISPDAEDRKRQHGLRGKIKKYSTQCNYQASVGFWNDSALKAIPSQRD